MINYPWIKSPENLPNNVGVAKAKLRSTESRHKKRNMERQQAYREQMNDMVRRGAARKLSDDEIYNY